MVTKNFPVDPQKPYTPGGCYPPGPQPIQPVSPFVGVRSVNGLSGDVVLKNLKFGNKEYNGSDDKVINAEDLGLEFAVIYLGKGTKEFIESLIDAKIGTLYFCTDNKLYYLNIGLNDWKKIPSKQYVLEEIEKAIGQVTHFGWKIVAKLPEIGEEGIIYLVPRSDVKESNIYDEFIWISETQLYEKIGSTEIDLSGYAKQTWVEEKLNQLKASLARVAFTGNYEDLINKPEATGKIDLVKINNRPLPIDPTDKSVNISTDNNSVIYYDDDNNALSIKGYKDAKQGEMLVKDAEKGLAWIKPLSDEKMREYQAAAERAAELAGNEAVKAANSAVEADTASKTAQRINEQTMNFVNDKFWWGSLEEYNSLEYIREDTFYFILD